MTSATIINVPGDCPTIQAGIDSCQTGDTVLVHTGTYVENINFNGHNIVLGSLFLTTGDTAYISTTIIDGDSAGTVVKFESGEDSTAVITGFTIQNGLNYYGGGIFCDNVNSPVISHNIIQENWATWWGGGIHCNNSSPNICHNYISGNSAQNGGGIFCDVSFAKINNNNIVGNTAFGGGGIYCAEGTPSIIDNIICWNSNGLKLYCQYSFIINNKIGWNNEDGIVTEASDSTIISYNYIIGNSRNGIFCTNTGSPIINNNIIVENQENGIFCNGNSSPLLSNNTVSRNSWYGLWTRDNSTPNIINSIFWANGIGTLEEIFIDEESAPTITYCNIQDTLWPGEGNISCDPQFCEPDSGNFDLNAFSCCVGAGQNGVDIGARGIGCWNCEGYVVGDINNSGDYNGLDVTYGVAYLKGGPPPPYECVCTPGNIWYASGDVNGSCSYNGLDITYGVSYLKGIQTELFPCPDCPPVR